MSIFQNLLRNTGLIKDRPVSKSSTSKEAPASQPASRIDFSQERPELDPKEGLRQITSRYNRNVGDCLPVGRSQVLERVRVLESLPSLASLTRTLQENLSDKGADLERVTSVIEKDTALTSRILRLANSAYFTQGEQLTSVFEAVARLGMTQIRNMVTTHRVLQDAQHLAPNFNWRVLWMHNVAVSMASEDLCDILGLETPPFLAAGGLVHDLGKVILSDLYPDHYLRVLTRAYETARPLVIEERSLFSTDHEEVGAVFARESGFPENLTAIIAFHRAPENGGDYAVQASVVQLANYFVKVFGLGFSGDRTFAVDHYSQLSGWKVIREQSHASNLRYIEQMDSLLKVSLDTSRSKIQRALRTWFQ
ncbi:MAG: HDOD domain-containing protein [Verrucomicrobiota bacterium JB022]|nr:HDOD domain-containing protein [Verrucomicrobiota bacterium JB022]